VRRLIVVLLAASGCGNSNSPPPPPPKTADQPIKLAGVYPEKFQCDSIVTPDVMSQVLGAPAHPLDSAMSPPKGVPMPCSYLLDSNPQETWTFDIDCRDGMKQRADALFAQYTTDSASQVQEYEKLQDAGALKPSDAGIVQHAPEGAAEVNVGSKGLDHHGQGLIFIDDDAPCYVRVIGPDAGRRLDLARLVAKNLTFANAPMQPRRFP
jgi:hypothetical protein